MSGDLKAKIAEILEEYRRTLEHFGIARKFHQFDDLIVGRFIGQYGGDVEYIKTAIIGARSEPVTERFNPAKFLTLNRILDARKIERFVTLGSEIIEQNRETVPIKIPGRGSDNENR